MLRPWVVGCLAALAFQAARAGDDAPWPATADAGVPADLAGLMAAEQAAAAAEVPASSEAKPTDGSSEPENDVAAPVAAPASDASAAQDGASSAEGGSAAAVADAPAADAGEPAVTSSRDPFEAFNRKVYAFNDKVDAAVLRPVAEGYRRAVPEVARTGVDNFFGNLGDVWSALNKLLQGKVVESAQMTLRVATNTVFGLGGLLDPATEFGLERQPEDFGQTLGVWGVPTGPYLVLPLLGPSTVRDTAALPLDRVVASPSRYLGGGMNAKVGITGVQFVAVRAGLLSASKLLGDVALDQYAFLRDAYLARRRNQLYDGNPPEDGDGNR